MKTGLTVHLVVKNAPLIYYVVKSVYNYCDSILLYDIGSRDDHTIYDIYQLLQEDAENKIYFKRGNMSTIEAREKQRNMTKTPYFLIVNDYEVFYEETMKTIVDKILYNFSDNTTCFALPLIWFYDIDQVAQPIDTIYNGKIFKTNETSFLPNTNLDYISRDSNDFYSTNHFSCYKNIHPYINFKKMLNHDKDNMGLKLLDFKYPYVFYEDSFYISRWMDKQKENKNDS